MTRHPLQVLCGSAELYKCIDLFYAESDILYICRFEKMIQEADVGIFM